MKVLGEPARRLTIGDLRRAIAAVPEAKDGEGVEIILPINPADHSGAYLHKAVYSSSKQISFPGFVMVCGEPFTW